MERGVKGPVLVEGGVKFEPHEGIMFITRNGRCREAMRMSVFHDYIYGGLRALQEWHAEIEAAGAPTQIFRERGHG